MVYNPNQFKEKEMPKPGTRIEAEVTEIESGILSDFVDSKTLAKWEHSNESDLALQVTAVCESGEIRQIIMTYPDDNEIHPRSKLGKWRSNYGEYPKVGQKIFLIADAKGYFQFYL